MRMRGLVAGLVALAAAGTVAGCGAVAALQSAVDPAADAKTVNLAAARTEHLRGFRLSGTMSLDTGGQLVQTSFTGAMNVRQGIASLRQHVRIGGRTVSIHDIYRGATVYSDLSDLPGFPHGQRHWLSLNITRAFGTPVPSTGDPAQFVNFLRTPGLHASSMGTQSAGGIAATLYRVTLNLNAYLRALPRADRAQAGATVDVAERATGTHTLKEDVWVDRAGLIRQLSWGFTECVAGQPLTTSMLMDLSHFGPTPRFRVPPAAQTKSLTSAMRGALAHVRQLPLGCDAAA